MADLDGGARQSPEHGRNIQRLLPQWQLIDATAVLPDLDSPGQFGTQPPCPAIITLVAASQLDNFTPDVLIVMGGDWVFDLPNIAAASNHPVIVVEFGDDFDDKARDASTTSPTGIRPPLLESRSQREMAATLA